MGNVNVYVSSEDMSNQRFVLIINKIISLKKIISNLEIEKSNLLHKIKQSYIMNDRIIYFNNLKMYKSLIDFYNSQIIFLENKCLVYKSIKKYDNKLLMEKYLSIWENEVDIYFSTCFNFEFNEDKEHCEFDYVFDEFDAKSDEKILKIN